jgi:hypothetical protein
VGCLFLAHRGAGAYVSPLPAEATGSSISAGKATLQRISVQDASDMQQARFMESYESRHSDHSFTAAVVSLLPRSHEPNGTILTSCVVPWHWWWRLRAYAVACLGLSVAGHGSVALGDSPASNTSTAF